QLAEQMLPSGQSALHPQATMETGALQRTPQNPDSGNCPIRLPCYAYNNKKVRLLPVKLKAAKCSNRYFHYFILSQLEGVWMQQRKGGDIWENLYEFPVIEHTEPSGEGELFDSELVQTRFGPKAEIVYSSSVIKHVLSHQNIYARFYEVRNVD